MPPYSKTESALLRERAFWEFLPPCTGPVSSLGPSQVHVLCWIHWRGAHLEQGEECNLRISPSRSERNGPFTWQGRAFSPEQSVPRKPRQWAEASAIAASSLPWKITQSAALPTGCQADALLLSETFHLLRMKNNNVPGPR